jgi:hypothetical protein
MLGQQRSVEIQARVVIGLIGSVSVLGLQDQSIKQSAKCRCELLFARYMARADGDCKRSYSPKWSAAKYIHNTTNCMIRFHKSLRSGVGSPPSPRFSALQLTPSPDATARATVPWRREACSTCQAV